MLLGLKLAQVWHLSSRGLLLLNLAVQLPQLPLLLLQLLLQHCFCDAFYVGTKQGHDKRGDKL